MFPFPSPFESIQEPLFECQDDHWWAGSLKPFSLDIPVSRYRLPGVYFGLQDDHRKFYSRLLIAELAPLGLELSIYVGTYPRITVPRGPGKPQHVITLTVPEALQACFSEPMFLLAQFNAQERRALLQATHTFYALPVVSALRAELEPDYLAEKARAVQPNPRYILNHDHPSVEPGVL